MKFGIYILAFCLTFCIIGVVDATEQGQVDCIQRGIRFKNSSVWKHDACSICSCNNKIIVCHNVTCEDPLCDATKGESLFLPPNACCPQCTTSRGKYCSKHGEIIAHNTVWKGKNCTECSCTNGAILCSNVKCNTDLNCGYGEIQGKGNGDCCEKCVSNGATCQYNDITYRDGDVWSPSKCQRARCVNGEIVYHNARCSSIVCPPGQKSVLLPDQCCPQCMGSTCIYEGKQYHSEEQFQLSPCRHCVCSGGKVTCTTTDCGMLGDVASKLDGAQPCPQGSKLITREGRCCPECVSVKAFCDSDGVRHYDGELWNASNCQVCSCSQGFIRCFRLQCSLVHCNWNEKLVHQLGSCCPECIPVMSQCVHNDLHYLHGDEWQIGACERCACIHGVTQCYTADCPLCPQRTIPVKIPGECCPTCEPMTCHADCASCNGPGYGHCTTCKNDRFLLQEGKCVRRCLTGFFQQEKLCKRCHSSCESCVTAYSNHTCTSCSSPMLLQEGSCIDECSTGFYDDDGVCKKCAQGCKRCLRANLCVECNNRTLLIERGECVERCAEDFYYHDNKCKPCHSSCMSCTQSSDTCDSCQPHKFMQNNLCVTECSQRFYKTSFRTCEACHSTCASCTGQSSSSCSSCLDNKVLHEGKCLDQCPAMYYASKGKCEACHSSCHLCAGSSASDCTVCASTNHVIQPSSPLSLIGQCIEKCMKGYYLNNRICKVCHDSCDSCNGPENVNCTSCKTDSYIFVTSQLKSMCITSNQCWSLSLEVDSSSEQCLNVKDLNKCRALRKSLVLTSDESDGLDITGESKCVSTCPKGTYQKAHPGTGSICFPCSGECASCRSNGECLECSDGKEISKITSQCVDQCEDGYYAVKSGQCTPCPSSCVTCELSASGAQPRCTSCREQTAVLQFGECIAFCAEQFYADIKGGHLGTATCRECDWTCRSCHGSAADQCLSCMPGMKLEQGRCLNQCSAGFYDSSSVCVRCKSPHCISCSGANVCQQCKKTFLLHHNQCLTSCPRGYTSDPIRNECVACPAHCLRCSAPGSCDQCDGQSFMVQNPDPLRENSRSRRPQICVKNCHKGYYGNKYTRICKVNKEKPIVSVIKPIVVTMGGRVEVNRNILMVSDKDTYKEQIILILEMEPSNGWIEVDNARVRYGFQMAATKIERGQVWFVHDPALRRPGVVTVKASDGQLESASVNVDIVVVSAEAPVIVKNKLLTISSGQSVKISSILEIEDNDNPSDVTLTRLSSPKYGNLMSSFNRRTEITDFSLQDLSSGSVVYTSKRNLGSRTALTDMINLQISDGFHIVNAAVHVQILPELKNSPLLLTNQAGRVLSKGLLQITNALLKTVAPNVKDKSKLVYVIKPENYTSGEVVRIIPMSSDDPMTVTENWVHMEKDMYRSAPLMSFTQKDVDEGNIWYRDLGGQDQVEAFRFQILDESHKQPQPIISDRFLVNVVPENSAAPHVARGLSFPPQMTANEDRITVIHSGYMKYTDKDTPDRDLIYNITKSFSSEFGSIEHADHPYIPITVFTQSDIDSNKIMFRPRTSDPPLDIQDEVITDDDYDDMESEIGVGGFESYGDYSPYVGKFEALTLETKELPATLEFEYTVSDGQHTLTPSNFTIKLSDQGNNAAPTFTNPHPRLNVTQEGTAPIGMQQLSVSDPDTRPRDLIFTLVKLPQHGSVIRNDQENRIILREGDSFTHDEIQRNSLQYIHDGTNTLTDQIQVSVTDVIHTATKVIQIKIFPTDSTGPTPDLTSELSLVVHEGSVGTLTRENLAYVDNDSTDAEIIFHVETELVHGILDSEVLGDIIAGDTFTQEDINVGYIKYRSRDEVGSNPLTDELHFSVTDSSGNKLENQLLTITITPGENQPPVVSVGNGITVSEGDSVLITPRDVIATDSDTPKNDLIITITKKPEHGYFLNTLRSDVMNADEDEVWFRMQDVLDGAIYYVQSLHHHSEPKRDFFAFRVSDGHNLSPIYGMNITIAPTNDEEPVVSTHSLVCKYGHATLILNASLSVKDIDTPTKDLIFTVTSIPQYGALVRFSQKMPHDVLKKWKMMGNGSLQLDMIEKKKLMKLRVGSKFSYQDVLDQLICYESEGYNSEGSTIRRRRRDTLGFILSDGSHQSPGSINIEVDPGELDNYVEEEQEEEENLILEEEVVSYKTLEIPILKINTGITVDKGTTTVIKKQNLKASDEESLDNSAARYVVVRGPAVGYLQLFKNRFVANITSSGESMFTQLDIDEGMLRYVHPKNQPGGQYNFRFHVVGASGSTLQDQVFNIRVKEDRKPPVIHINDGIAVEESSSQKITAEKLSATDEVSANQLLYTITEQPKLGRLVLTSKPAGQCLGGNYRLANVVIQVIIRIFRIPGHAIRTFTQADVNDNRVTYIHTNRKEDQLKDEFKFALSDGTNTIFQTFSITVLPVDNSLPFLENAGIRVQEGVRKTITEFELRVMDADTKDDLITFTILQAPQHGTIKRTNHRSRYIPVTSFNMEDIYQSRISYNHDGSNSVEDRFTFLVSDGTNSEFTLMRDGRQITTSSQQTFHITIIPVDNGTPRLVTNLGLNHLDYSAENEPIGSITKRNLLTEDPDTTADLIVYTITAEPQHGHIESTANPGQSIKSFTQEDINSGTIHYVLSDTSMAETRDSFMFNVRDSMPNVVTGNIFHIRWSIFTLDKASYTVKEGDGHVDILVRRTGNLNYAIVSCRTESGTATSINSNTPGELDYVEHAGQVQFDEHEDEKVCTIELHDDKVFEGEEQFTVQLAMPSYALLGAVTETTVTIDDSEDMPSLEFVDSEVRVQENDDAVFLTVKRTGDIQKTVSVICSTESKTATGTSQAGGILSGADYKSRENSGVANEVLFPPGMATATCDVKLIDDSIYEEDEEFIVRLSQPSAGAEVGEQAEATVTIAGPNDAASVFFSDHHYEFSENQGIVDVTVVRTGSDLSQSTDVWCSTRATNPPSAVPGEDFVQSSNKVTFRNGETMKVCSMTILDDSQAPSLEGNETFEVYLSSVLRAKLATPHKAIVTINDTLDDIPTMEFLKTDVEVKENKKILSLAIKREGDIKSSSSVICYTRHATADVEEDFNERAKTETSRVTFKEGQKLAYCNVSIIDDNSYESSERFSVHLSNAVGSKWYGARVGESKTVEITITNDEDAPTITFERAEFSIREPDEGEEYRQLVVHVLRTGDTTEVSKVRCSTRDGSATSGSDYEPNSKMLRFQPGDREVTFQVNILPNDDTEWHETFLLVLGPDDPVNAILGSISQATVTVLDKDAAGSLILPTTPVVVSLLDYDDVKTGLENDPSPGYPLICVTPCDPRFPQYADTRNLCEEAGINASAIAFSWEVAMPTNSKKGGSHPFVRVQDSTPFTSVNTKVLDSIYFSRRFHVRCVAQAVDSATGTGGTPLRSNVVKVGTDSGLCHSPIVSGSERGFQAQSFIANLNYIPPTAEEYPDTMQILVEIPHQDGRLPLISTMPINNLKLLLSRSIDRQQHLCSNMMYSNAPSKTVHIKPSDLTQNIDDRDLGKYLGFIETTDYSKLSLGPGFDKPFQLDPTVREPKTIDLYKYLNLKSCVWKFNVHYKMDQLIDYCNGKIDPDYELRDAAKSLVTVTVPLHVSYVYVTAPTGWGSLEHRTEMQFSFVYDTVLWIAGIQTEGTLSAKFQVKKMRIRDDGRFEINFETKVQFRGLFVLQHHTLPGRQSRVLAPDGLNIEFELENIWNASTFDYPRQQWRAVSSYSRKDYSGEYEIQLLPCTVAPTVKWKTTEPGKEVSCTADAPKKFKLPVTFQQTNRPVPVVYSLNTAFYLCNNEKLFTMDPAEGKENELDYKGAFSKGQTIFGRVFWDPNQNLNAAYKLQLEKVYLCTGHDGYIPTFDPDGSVYHEGEQYGCIQKSKRLQHRFLLLDRSNRAAENRYFRDMPFEAYFSSDKVDYEKLSQMPGVDGFLIKVDALYSVEAGHQWYLQVLYAIGPEDMMLSRSRRSVIMSVGDLKSRKKRAYVTENEKLSALKNGTNMRGIAIDEASFQTDTPSTFVVIAILVVILLLVIPAFLVYRRRRRRNDKSTTEVNRKIVIADARKDYMKKCVSDDEQESDDSWPLSGEREHKRSNSNGLATVTTLTRRNENRFEKNFGRKDNVTTDIELMPLNAPRRSSSQKQNNQTATGRTLVGKSTSRKKSIPIVNNLHNQSEDDDGTEV